MATITTSSEEAEQAVIGCLLLDPARVPFFAQYISARSVNLDDLFTSGVYRLMAKTIVAMHERELPIDLITFGQALRDLNVLDYVGGLVAISRSQDAVPSAGAISYYLDILVEKLELREAESALTLGLMALRSGTPIADVSRGLVLKSHQVSRDKTIAELTHLADTELQERFSPTTRRIELGIRSLDRLLRTVGPEFVLIAARPSLGKTSCGLTIARNLAVRYPKRRVGIISLEDNEVALTTKLIDLNGRLSSFHFDQFDAFEHRAYAESRTAVSKMPIDIHYGQSSLDDVLSKIDQWATAADYSAVVIDYLQKIDNPNARTEYDSITSISKALSYIPKKYGFPVIALAQLQRDAEGERPEMKHLRGSGQLEQDADVILLLNTSNGKERVHLPLVDASIILDKRRNGQTGEALVRFHRYCGLWESDDLPEQ